MVSSLLKAHSTGLLPLHSTHWMVLSRREATPPRICSIVPLTAPSLIADIRSILIGHTKFLCCPEMACSRTFLLFRGSYPVQCREIRINRHCPFSHIISRGSHLLLLLFIANQKHCPQVFNPNSAHKLHCNIVVAEKGQRVSVLLVFHKIATST